MPEVIFPGPEGRLEGRYHPQKERDAPIAIVLHPHPNYGGTMNNKVVFNLHYAFLQPWIFGAAVQFPRCRTLARRI